MNTIKNSLKAILTFVLVALGFTFAPPASATDTPAPVPVININVSAAEKAELKVDTTTTLLTDAEGRMILGPVSNPKNKGALHWLKKDGNRCPLVADQPRTDKQLAKIKPTTFIKKGSAFKRFKKAVPSSKVVKKLEHGKRKLAVTCYRVAVGGEITDTMEDAAGNQHGGLNVVEGSPMLFDVYKATVKEADGDVVTKPTSRRRGQVSPGSNQFDDGDCLNPKNEVVEYIPGQYVYTKAWGKLRQQVKGALSQRLHVAGEGRVQQGDCYVKFNYDFNTQGELAFDQIFWAKTKAEAEGEAAKVATNMSTTTNVQGSIENSLRGQLLVAFGEKCNGGVTPEAVVSLDEGNDLDLTDPNCEGTRDECESYTVLNGHVTVPGGVSGVVRVDSNFGSAFFSNGTRAVYTDDFSSFNAGAGQYDPQIRLNASTEMPSYACTKPGVPAGSKCFLVTLTFTPSGSGAVVTAKTEFVANPVPQPLP